MSEQLGVEQLELTPEVVRDRFRWALRQGNPRWLWPETTPERWQAALHHVEHATRHVLTGHGQPAVLEGNAQDIGLAALTSGMGPLLGYWITAGLLEAEPPIRALLELHYNQNGKRMEYLAHSASAVVNALHDAGVDVTILKGIDTAYRFFPSPGSRPLSDIDLWINGPDEPAAARVLTSLGYEPGDTSYGEQAWRMSSTPVEPRTLSLVHEDDPWTIDLHRTLDRRYSAGAPTLHLDSALGPQRKCAWLLSAKGNVLSGEGLLVHLASHASLELRSLSMLRVTELIFVIRKLEEEQALSWGGVLQTAETAGPLGALYPAFHMVNQLAPGTIPENIAQIFERGAPTSVKRVIGQLSPATCQRLARSSFEERFMWTGTLRGFVRELTEGLVPTVSFSELGRIYRMRFWRLARGTITLTSAPPTKM